jgi:hypothetical protein
MLMQRQNSTGSQSPSTATQRAPRVGTLIDFTTPGAYVVRGAMVTRKEHFCGEQNYFVEYTFQGDDGRLCGMTGWVAGKDVL